MATAFWVGLLVMPADASFAELLWVTGFVLLPVAILLEAVARWTGSVLHCGTPEWRARVQEIYRPLALLPLAAVTRIVPVPWMPIVLGLAVATAGACRFTAAIPAPLRESDRRRLSLLAFALVLAPGLVLWQTTVIHDAFQYHATAVSIFMQRSYDTFEPLFLYNSHRSYNPYPEGSIRYLGVPLLQVPALALGHVTAAALQVLGWGFAANGFSLPYFFWISVLSSAAGVAGLVLTYRWVARRTGRRIAFAAISLMLWASGLPMFLFLWHGWTHTYSLFGVSMFLLQRDRLLELPRPSVGAWCVLGLTAGLLCLVWPVNGLILSLSAGDLLAGIRRYGGRVVSVWSVALAAGVLLGFVPQLAGWYGATGQWGGTYGRVGDYFQWSNPQLLPLLFSWAQHGLFTWHPVFVPAFLGLLLGRDRPLGLALGVWVVVEIYVLSCWSVWWTGIGFGNRFFLNLLPVAALGLAQLLAVVWRAGRFQRLRRCAVATVALALVIANLSLMNAYRSDVIPMGIKGPNYVQDPPPAAADLVAALRWQAPLTVDFLTRDFWVNQAFIPSRLRTAVAGDPAAWLSITVGVVLVGTIWSLAVWLALWRRRQWPWTSAVVAAATLAVSAWLVLAVQPSPASHQFMRIDAGETILRPGQKATFVPQGYLEPTREIDLISFLTYAVYVPQERPVAVMRVFLEGQGTVERTLVAGVDTAETSAFRPEVRALMRHGWEQTVPVHEWVTRAYSRALYPAHAFLARIQLPHPARVEYIEIEMLHGGGDLVLRDVFLRG
jgi:hypothetical protein